MLIQDILQEYNNPKDVKAYREGKNAAALYHVTGQGHYKASGGECPHKDGTEEAQAWKHGWSDGYYENFPAD